MDILPGKGLVKSMPAGAEGSIRQASAPWMALGYVGEHLQEMGEGGMKLLVEAKRADTRRRTNDMELVLAKTQADYENEMVNNPDPTTWVDGLRKRIEGVRSQYINDKLAPEEQEAYGSKFAEWEAKANMGVARNATVALFEQDKQSAANLIEYGELTGDDVPRQKGLAALEERVGPVEAAKVRMESNRRFDRTRLESEIRQYPMDVEKSITEGNLREKFPGLSNDDINWAADATKTRLRVYDGDVINEYANLAAGDNPALRTPDDVARKFAGKVEPRLLEQMQDDMRKRNNAQEKEFRATPGYQQGVIGKVSNALQGYTLPAAGSHDYKLDELTVAAYSLPEGSLRNNLLEQIRNKRAGLETKVKNKAEAAQKALDTHFKSLATKSLPKTGKIATKEMVEDGFLKDWRKVMAGGFSKSIAKDIAKLAEKDPAKAQAKVKDLWSARTKGNIQSGVIEAQTLDAIRLEKSEIDWIDPETEDKRIEAEKQHEHATGKAKMALSEWLEQHPDANDEEIKKQVLDIAGAGVEDDLQRSFDEEDQPAIDPSTSQNLGLPEDARSLVGMIKHFEGFDEEAKYFGAWSIGYGTAAKPGDTITREEAEVAMNKQIGVARGLVRKEAERIGMTFTPNEEDALTSFAYNTKPGNLQKLLDGGNRTKEQIAAALIHYRNADGKRYDGLERRRRAEQAMFLAKNETNRNTGEFSDYNVIN